MGDCLGKFGENLTVLGEDLPVLGEKKWKTVWDTCMGSLTVLETRIGPNTGKNLPIRGIFVYSVYLMFLTYC